MKKGEMIDFDNKVEPGLKIAWHDLCNTTHPLLFSPNFTPSQSKTCTPQQFTTQYNSNTQNIKSPINAAKQKLKAIILFSHKIKVRCWVIIQLSLFPSIFCC